LRRWVFARGLLLCSAGASFFVKNSKKKSDLIENDVITPQADIFVDRLEMVVQRRAAADVFSVLTGNYVRQY
jgi:hypothetical protein